MKRSQPSSEHASSRRKPIEKKTRFIAPEDDPASFAEDVDAQLEENKKVTRKGGVKTEGYDSDSSDDGEGVVLSRRKNAGKDGGDDDDDMFAMGDKEDSKAEESPAKKKKEEYLRLGDIEGQEFNEAEGSGGEVEEDELADTDESEPEDEDDAERRKKAGMGFELSKFNMRDEMEEGKFTADGSFVRTFDPHAAHDRWLEGTDEREMKKARRAKRALERKERDRLRREQKEEDSLKHGGKSEIEKEMLTLMKRGETVLEALARLGDKVKKAKDKEKQLRKTQQKHHRAESLAMELDTNGNAFRAKPVQTPSKDPPQKQQIEQLTALSSQLMGLGDIDIYNKTYEHILRSVRSAGNVEPDWLPPPTQYEYKWDIPEAPQVEGQEQVYGPYGGNELKEWYDAAYFGISGEKVKVRTVGGEWGDWDEVVD